MSVRSGQSITDIFSTRDSTSQRVNADSLPTGTLYVNGTSDAASVTVTNITTGLYKFAVTLPTLAFGDRVTMNIVAIVDGVTDNGQVWTDTKDIGFDSSGIVLADAVKINSVATTSVTTVNANVGTTQPTNFTGTSSSALVKSDMVDVAGAAVSTSTAQIGVNVVSFAAGVGPLAPIRANTMQAGSTSTTAVLDTGASSVNDYYRNDMLYITGGTGSTSGGQARKILSYVGSTRTATVRAWTTTPDNTTTFAILPDTSVWDDVTADHLTSGSTGASLNAGGNPWATALPGAFLSGTAGHILGTSLPDIAAGSAGGLHRLGANTGDTNYTGVSNSAMTYTGATGVPAVQMSGTGNNAVGLQIDGGSGSNSAGIIVLGKLGASINGTAGAGLAVAGTTFSINCTGAVSMANASNAIVLGTTEEAVIAGAVWDVVIASHLTTGTTGKALNSASTAGDPWVTLIPGSYGAGTAGHRLGNIPDVAAGAAGGVLIAGSNAATTFATLTSTGAFTINGTSDVAQTGDSYSRIGATGSSLTSLAPSATALSTVQWTNTLATNLGTTNTAVAANLDATVSSRLAPTVAARTLDVTATGGAGIDWGNVENQSTSVTLSGTTINAVTTVTVPTAAAIATAVWQDTTSGDFTVSGSIGQNLFTGIAPGASGGFVKIGTNTGNIAFSGIVTANNASNDITGIDVKKWLGTTVATPTTAGVPEVDATFVNGDSKAALGLEELGTDYHTDGAAKANIIIMGADSITATALASSATAEIATAWGASVIGNSRTRDYFLQGGISKFSSNDPGAGYSTLYQTDDATPLKTFATTSSAVDPITSMDPTT